MPERYNYYETYMPGNHGIMSFIGPAIAQAAFNSVNAEQVAWERELASKILEPKKQQVSRDKVLEVAKEFQKDDPSLTLEAAIKAAKAYLN